MIDKLLAIPRSLIVNLRLFGWKGIKCPILISNNTKLGHIKYGHVEISNSKIFGIQIGFGGTEGIVENRYSYLRVDGVIKFQGTACFARGSSIRVDSGTFEIGDNFACNKNCFISCCENVEIGKNVLLGWNVNIRDSDGHTVYVSGVEKANRGKVHIGDNVWLASYVDVLKGSHIASGSIVGYRSCVNKAFFEENVLIVGNPAKIKGTNISWKI